MLPILRKVRNAFFVLFGLSLLLKGTFLLWGIEFAGVRANYLFNLLLLVSIVVFSLWFFLFVDFKSGILNRLKDTLGILGVFGTLMMGAIYGVLALGILSRGVDPGFQELRREVVSGTNYAFYKTPGEKTNEFSLSVRREQQVLFFRKAERLQKWSGVTNWSLENKGEALFLDIKRSASNRNGTLSFRLP